MDALKARRGAMDLHERSRARPGHGRPMAFFALTFVLSLPFWILASVAGGHVLLPMGLPISALQFIAPLAAAVILTRGGARSGGPRSALRRVLDVRRISPSWWIAIVSIMPAVHVLAYVVMVATGQQVPEPQIALGSIPFLLVIFLVTAAAEQAGWTHYATEALQGRYSELTTALLVGGVWAAWHVVPYLQAERELGWIAWQFIFTVAARVIISAAYNRTAGSLLAAIVVHATINTSVGLFPVEGSHYDPAFVAPISVLAAVIVVLGGGTLLSAPRGRSSALPVQPNPVAH